MQYKLIIADKMIWLIINLFVYNVLIINSLLMDVVMCGIKHFLICLVEYIFYLREILYFCL